MITNRYIITDNTINLISHSNTNIFLLITNRNIKLYVSYMSWALHVGFGTRNTHRRNLCRTQMRVVQATVKSLVKPLKLTFYTLNDCRLSIEASSDHRYGLFCMTKLLLIVHSGKNSHIILRFIFLLMQWFKSYPSRLFPSKS